MNTEIVLENTKEEEVVIVDENDNVVGTNTRKEMVKKFLIILKRAKNLIHRSTAILVINKDTQKYLVQTRSKEKEFCPGYLDIIFGGVVSSGEENSIDESAIREMNEELGLDIKKINSNSNGENILNLEFIGKCFYKDEKSSSWCYVYVFFLPPELGKEIKFKDGEVESVQWLSENEINDKIQKEEKLTPDGVECFKFFLKEYFTLK